MDTFYIKGFFKFQRILWRASLLVVILGGLLAAALLWSESQRHSWAPLATIVFFIWFIYDLYKLITESRFLLKFSVSISDESIQVGENAKLWSEIKKAEIKNASGTEPGFILHTDSEEQIKIPASVESPEYIKGIIERHVNDVSIESN